MPNAFSVQLRRIDSIRPYEANPRINDQAVDAVAAGLSSFGDAKTVDLFRYAAWLTLELFKPRGEPQTYEERKRRQPERHAAAARAAQDIGEIPGVVDPGRKAKAEELSRFFCNTYFPDVFYLQYMCGFFSNKNLTTAETWCKMR